MIHGKHIEEDDLYVNPFPDGGNSNIFYFHPENWGRWTYFDVHIFQMGGSTTNKTMISGSIKSYKLIFSLEENTAKKGH